MDCEAEGSLINSDVKTLNKCTAACFERQEEIVSTINKQAQTKPPREFPYEEIRGAN
jgi:hypothetical protein